MNFTIRSKNKVLFLLLSLGILSSSISLLNAAEPAIDPVEASVSAPSDVKSTENQPSAEEIELVKKALEKATPIYNESKKTAQELISVIHSLAQDVKEDKITLDNKDVFIENCLQAAAVPQQIVRTAPAQTDLSALDELQFFTGQAIGYLINALFSEEKTAILFDIQNSIEAYQNHVARKAKEAQEKNLSIDDMVGDLQNTHKQLAQAIEYLKKEIVTLKKLTTLYSQTKANLNQLSLILNSVNLNVKNNNIIVADKSQFQENCLELIEIINWLRAQLPVKADLIKVCQLQHYIAEISDHVAQTFKTKNPTLARFDVQKSEEKFAKSLDEKLAVLTKGQVDNDKVVKSLLSDLEKNKKNHATLLADPYKTTDEFGLTKVNKAYRKWNAAVWERMYKWGAFTKIKLGATAAATGLIAFKFFRPGHTMWENPILKPLLYGDVKLNKTETSNMPDDNEQAKYTSLMTFIDGLISKCNRGEQWTLAGLSAITIPVLKNQIYDPLTEWIYKKGRNAHYNLMGGAYKKRGEELDNMLIEPRRTFDDIVGNAHAKKEFQKAIDFLERPEFFFKNGITPSRGFLLTGHTGSGKSYLVEAFAGEIKKMFKRLGRDPKTFNFFPVASYWFADAASIERLFIQAQQLAPCVLWIDELDMYNLTRTGNMALLQQVLIQMSGALDSDPDKAVIVIAATNNPQAIDFALKRPGRMETHIEISLPGFKDRREFFMRIISGLASPGAIDFDRLSNLTEGQTYQALRNIVNAASFANAVNHTAFTQELLEQIIDSIVHNIESVDGKELADDEKQLIAINQAGHALAMLLLDSKSILTKVNTKPFIVKLPDDPIWNQVMKNKMMKKPQDIKKYGRVYRHYKKDSHGINTYDELIKQCKIALAGNAAERVVFGACGYTYKGEYSAEYAFELAMTIVSKGINLENISPNVKAKYEEQALELLQRCEQEAYELLNSNKEALVKVIAQLLEKEELSRAQICNIAGITDTEAPAPRAEKQAMMPTAA